MAVYEQTYKRYTGALTPRAGRFLTIFRYAWNRLTSSKLAILLLAVSVLFTLGAMLLIYLNHNTAAMAILGLKSPPIAINAKFFTVVLGVQLGISSLMLLIVGPPLISMDVVNGALPLYFARPITRAEYVLGKLAILAVVLSALTWGTGLGLFFFEAALADSGWLATNWSVGVGLFVGSWVWILVTSFLVLALSAWVRWPLATRGLMLVIFLMLPGFGAAFNAATATKLGNWLDLSSALTKILGDLMGVISVDVGQAWVLVALVFAGSLWLLVKKLRAYEVVS